MTTRTWIDRSLRPFALLATLGLVAAGCDEDGTDGGAEADLAKSGADISTAKKDLAGPPADLSEATADLAAPQDLTEQPDQAEADLTPEADLTLEADLAMNVDLAGPAPDLAMPPAPDLAGPVPDLAQLPDLASPGCGADNTPEDQADEEMSYWTDDGDG